jgi:heme-degrading monooxygenase HmoA
MDSQGDWQPVARQPQYTRIELPAEDEKKMFVAVTRIKDVPPPVIDRMVEGFRRGAQDLKAFEGFIGFELWRTENSLEAVSRWTSREAMEEYRKSPAFGAHHQGSQTGGETAAYDAEVVI